MNSLTELNGFVSGFTLPYTDERLPDVLFDRGTASNQTQSVDRGFTVSGSVGIEIIEILNPALSNPTYQIDVSNLPGATVSYASLPPGVSLTNPSTGVYIITGFTDKTQWDLIKSPTIDFSDDYFGSFTYTSTISYYSYYTGSQTRSWTTAVTVNNILFWTNANQFIYQQSAVTNFSGTPLLGNLDASYPNATWSVTITPSVTTSINTFTTTGTGGTFSVNASTKVISITGTRAQVNSRLSGLRIDANAATVDFVLTYFVSNNLNGVTDTRTQTLLTQGLAILGSVSQPTIYYNEDTAFTLTGAPQITDISFDGTGTYTYTITPSDTAGISNITASGSGGSVSFNGSTKVFTITGTRSQVNGRLSGITITPTTDYAQNFNLTYFCSTPRADTATKVQVVLLGSNDTEVTNMNINRNFTGNNSNSIFASSTPFISDLDATNPTYTVIFDCPNGQWTQPANLSPYVEGALLNPLSITGTKAFINARFSQIKFYPTANFSTNTTFTYTQIKNGVTQVNQTVGLIGTAGSYNNARTVDFIISQVYTPSVPDVLYGKIDRLLLIGGGGGGGGSSPNFGGGGGGGGGVRYVATDINFSPNTSYNLVIGAGGQGGTSTLNQQTGVYGTNGTAGGTTTGFGYSIAGGQGGTVNGVGGTSGPLVGFTNDHNGKAGGLQSTTNNSLSGRNGGGGGGHPSTVNTTTGVGANGSTSSGGRGSSGADGTDIFGTNGWAGAGGGGGGHTTRGSAGDANTSSAGANNTSGPTTPSQLYYGGGGGGGFGSFSASNGLSGSIKIRIVSK